MLSKAHALKQFGLKKQKKKIAKKKAPRRKKPIAKRERYERQGVAAPAAGFNAPKEQTLWYYRELANAFQTLFPGQLADESTEIVIVLKNK